MNNSATNKASPELVRPITVRPNDRAWRATLAAIGLLWWCQRGLKAIGDDQFAVQLVFVLLWFGIALLLLCLLFWAVAGVEVFDTDGNVLTAHRRIGFIPISRAKAYSFPLIATICVEERVTKIKGNTSTRYALMIDEGLRKKELVWRRTRAEADALRSAILQLIK